MIAGSGLRAANAALNTTNNNVANASTEGYSRQTVVQEANAPLRTFVKYGCAGAGVQTIAIERNRSEFYDAKYRSNNTRLGIYEIKEYYQMQVQQYLKDDGKPASPPSMARSAMHCRTLLPTVRILTR